MSKGSYVGKVTRRDADVRITYVHSPCLVYCIVHQSSLAFNYSPSLCRHSTTLTEFRNGYCSSYALVLTSILNAVPMLPPSCSTIHHPPAARVRSPRQCPQRGVRLQVKRAREARRICRALLRERRLGRVEWHEDSCRRVRVGARSPQDFSCQHPRSKGIKGLGETHLVQLKGRKRSEVCVTPFLARAHSRHPGRACSSGSCTEP